MVLVGVVVAGGVVVDDAAVVAGATVVVVAGSDVDDGNVDACGTCSAACDTAQAAPNDCADGVGCISGDDCLSTICTGGVCTAV